MARLVKPSTGQAVEVADSDRLLLGYYRGEGFVEQQAPAVPEVSDVQAAQLPEPDPDGGNTGGTALELDS